MISITMSSVENWIEGSLEEIERWSIHWSYQRLIDFPLPTVHLLPDCKRGDKGLSFFQMQEPPLGLHGDRIEESLKYRAWNQAAYIESTITIAQPNLNRLASLNSFILRRPSPPSFLGKQTVSHFTKLLLVLFGEADQRKFLINFS